MDIFNKDKQSSNLRRINTARDIVSINKAVEEGFIPLFRKVQPSSEIKSKYAIYRDKATGVFEIFSDYRSISRHSDDYEEIINWTYYYPYSFSSPFAAYLIPKDLSVGERVFIEDVIEDYVSEVWNQGDVYRLQCCEAIWDGSNLNIQFNPKLDRQVLIG